MTTFFNFQDSGLDDWDQSKNYVQMGFRPGFAVQARELTQMQTVMQAQITALARRFMKSGSLVDAPLTLTGPSPSGGSGIWSVSIGPGTIYVEPTGKDIGYFVYNSETINLGNIEVSNQNTTRVYVTWEEVQVNPEGENFTAQGGFARVATDPSLMDNAQGYSNFSAPGASRYQINILGLLSSEGGPPINAGEVFYIQNGIPFYTDTDQQIPFS